MARTQAPDYDDRRQAIVDRAAELFAEMGFHRASIADLAVACGTSKSALYHYYQSKEAILDAILSDHTTLLLETAERVAAGDGDPETRLRRLAEALMSLYVTATAKHVVLLNEIASLPDEQRAPVIRRQRQIIDIILGLLVELRPDIADHEALRKPIAMMFMGAINWTYTWFDTAGPTTPARFANLVVDLFVRGLPGLDLAR